MKQTFRLELEIEVEYNARPDGIDNAPYTQVVSYIDDKGNCIIETDKGKIIDTKAVSFKRA